MRLLITVFDNESDFQIDQMDVTGFGFQNAADLVGVPIENLVYIHPLNSEQLSAISTRTGIEIESGPGRSYFLEGESEFPGETWPPTDDGNQ
jgi:hypothetical protein